MIRLALAVLLTACSADASVKTGKAAPDFKLKDSTGKERSLSEFKGKIVVLEWYNRECPYVVKHYDSGNMQKTQAEAGQKGAIWLSINTSAPGKQGHVDGKTFQAQMKKDKGFPTHMLLDHDGVVGKLYGAKTTPHMYVIDKEGILRYQGAIDSIASADQADIPKATNYVLAAINSLGKGEKLDRGSSKPYGCGVKYASN
jgi:peroxiredoxin